MRWECRERFPRQIFQRKPFVNDPGMHRDTHVPWCMSGSLTRGWEENVPGIPGACATRNFMYLARGRWPALEQHPSTVAAGIHNRHYPFTVPRVTKLCGRVMNTQSSLLCT